MGAVSRSTDTSTDTNTDTGDESTMARKDDFKTPSPPHRPPHRPPPPCALYRCIKRVGLRCTKCVRDCCHFRRPPHLKDQPVNVGEYLQIYIPKLLLEVCGAAGAFWGASEATGLRQPGHDVDINYWRHTALLVGLVFFQRFWWDSKHYLEHRRDYPAIKLRHRRHRKHSMAFVQIFSAKFLLNVCGATGAIWGFSDVLGWRTPLTVDVWRQASVAVGILFGMRWLGEILSYCLCFTTSTGTAKWYDCTRENASFLWTGIGRWMDLLIATVVLEVVGAGGAVWGFSEIIGLRTPANLELWRPLAMGTAIIFGIRWLGLIRAACQEDEQRAVVARINEPESTTANKRETLELEDLVLTETIDTMLSDGGSEDEEEGLHLDPKANQTNDVAFAAIAVV